MRFAGVPRHLFRWIEFINCQATASMCGFANHDQPTAESWIFAIGPHTYRCESRNRFSSRSIEGIVKIEQHSAGDLARGIRDQHAVEIRRTGDGPLIVRNWPIVRCRLPARKQNQAAIAFPVGTRIDQQGRLLLRGIKPEGFEGRDVDRHAENADDLAPLPNGDRAGHRELVLLLRFVRERLVFEDRGKIRPAERPGQVQLLRGQLMLLPVEIRAVSKRSRRGISFRPRPGGQPGFRDDR